jgi:F-type H+-transporting ATPase subunit gamma
MGSDRGLCGAFNNNVLKKTLQHIQVATPGLAEDQITILPIGNKVLSLFKKKQFHLVPDHIGLVRHLSFTHVRPVVTMLTEAFLQQVYDQIVLVYNAYQHAATYLPTVEKLLPIVVHDVAPSHQGEPIDYIYEPSPAALRLSLLPHVLQVRFYSALLAAHTSEHAARMIAMSKATENAETLLKDLRLTYNRTRQAAITQEISEIVAGANVLTG